MTQEQHPITPPLDLVQIWVNDAIGPDYEQRIAIQAARWGADQELDACCEWLVRNYNYPEAASPLRAARRPKPQSLKEKALLQLDTLNADLGMHGLGCDLSQIRRALESLPD